MQIDPWILTFSAATVLATIWMGFWSARRSKTAHDFYVAGRSVSVGWNASAISGEYLSAASFMGVAGMVMSSGYDALWYPVCYACGYLFLLLFIAGPLRRFGAYTIPDFAEGRFDSPLFRKIAVVFVLFIGFFYTMPQMKGAGTTLAYIFPGLPYWAGVVLVGAVITLNVALGGMKGITLVQAFQYWAKMFAISVPIFVLMAVYGDYGEQVGVNGNIQHSTFNTEHRTAATNDTGNLDVGRSMLNVERSPLPDKAPRDEPWLNPFGPLTTKAAKNAAAAIGKKAAAQGMGGTGYQPVPSGDSPDGRGEAAAVAGASTRSTRNSVPAGEVAGRNGRVARSTQLIPLRKDLSSTDRMTANVNPTNVTQALAMYADLTGSQLLPRTNSALEKLDEMLNHQLSRWQLVKPASASDTGVSVHRDGYFTASEVKTALEDFFRTNGVALVPEGPRYFRTVAAEVTRLTSNGKDQSLLTSAATAEKAWLAKHEKPLALLYTYSLIIALVCGTAGLPHILVRFYTNPDGVAAKRTTMWVMILIGVFYLFPPVFGVMGRNLLPDLYATTGAKGTDKVVLELPRILNTGRDAFHRVPDQADDVQQLATPPANAASGAASERSGTRSNSSLPAKNGIPWGSILSGITCAGAFAAFMSTFSGLLVSMTGALAHDVYGRMLNPKSTPHQRLRAFKICAVIIGGVAILLGTFVEPLQINFMVGQAFAIAAASYFPLLFMSAWWRGMTMRGAAIGMLAGGICALAAVTLTNFSDLGWFKLANFWAAHPLLRILCEQPAIWTVPLAIGLMIVVSKMTRSEVPSDIRMKMLVLHAPEKLGLKQEYIQEHQHGH